MVFASKTTYAALMLGYLVSVYAITKALEGSRYGYYLFAVRDDEDAAQRRRRQSACWCAPARWR